MDRVQYFLRIDIPSSLCVVDIIWEFRCILLLPKSMVAYKILSEIYKEFRKSFGKSHSEIYQKSINYSVALPGRA